MKDHPAGYAAFMTMYYTGVREGELLALTLSDIDFENGTIRINKSYQRLNGEDLITTPKTPKSKRVITIPESLNVCLKEYNGQRGESGGCEAYPYPRPPSQPCGGTDRNERCSEALTGAVRA